MKALENFLEYTHGAKADFTQTVQPPPKDGRVQRVKTSVGSFEFQRPDRFRFVYRSPFEQTIVADGQTLWLYDADLNQVTARNQAQSLGSTPVALIATAADLKSLQARFDLQNAPDQGGLQWVSATPRARDGQVVLVRVGFRGDELAALEISDSFGQKSTLLFGKLQVNPVFAADRFQYKPPAGADILRQ